MDNEKWLLKTSFLWDDLTEDEEPDEEFSTFDEAWDEAQKRASVEVKTTLEEHPESPVTTEYRVNNYKKEAHITLVYGYDNGICTFTVVRW